MSEWPNKPVQKPGDPPGGGPQPCAITSLDEFTAKVEAMDLAEVRETLLAKHAFEARLVEENKQLRAKLDAQGGQRK